MSSRLPAVCAVLALCLGGRGLAGQVPDAAASADSAPARMTGHAGAAPCHEMLLGAAPLSFLGTAAARTAELAGAARPRPHMINDPWSDLTVDLCRPATRPLSNLIARGSATGGLRVHLLPMSLDLEGNSAYPRDRENGLMWAGRGVSAAAYGGLELGAGILSLRLYPGGIYQQNRDFETAPQTAPGFSPLILPGIGTTIDLPQRMGTASFWTFDPGQSSVTLGARGFSLGVGTENLQWGPAIRNPLLLSYSAGGFPHAFVGTSRPVDIGIGHGELKFVWGRLTESPYFDYNPGNDHRLFAGTVGDIELRWLPGLYLGGASIYEAYAPPGGFGLSDYFRAILNRPISSIDGNAAGNGLAALYFRWAFPASGFEAYGEWARDDYAWTWRDFLMEPDHSQTYALGLQKVVATPGHWVRIHGELTHLESSRTVRSGRGEVMMYTNGTVIQGHTERGQMLGAAIGPGSDAQFLGVDVISSRGASGAYIERTRYNDDAYYDIWARSYGFTAHDVELTGALRQSLYWRSLVLQSEANYSYRLDRSFLGLDGTNRNLRVDHNLGLRLSFSWTPGASRTNARDDAAAH